MRVRFAALTIVGALLFAGLSMIHVGASAATTTLRTTQECLPDGRVQVRFDWFGNNPSANQQWLDLTLFNNDWAPGTFLGAGPMPGAQQTLTWPGLLEGTQHYVRINQLLQDGSWDPSPTFSILTGICHEGTTRPPDPNEIRVRVVAPIESAEIAVVGTPGGYAVKGVAGLPGGCARQGGSEVTQSGNSFKVSVYNTMPAVEQACTRIYGYYDYTIALGNTTPGTTYTVDVNGKVLTFTAAGGSNAGPAAPTSLQISGRIPDLNQTVPPGEGEAGRITLSWNDTSNNEDGFRIYQDCGGNVTVLTEVDANTTSMGPLQTCRPGHIGVASLNENGVSAILWSS